MATLQRGKSGWLAVRLTMKPGWHTYWRNPGDSGLATSIKWTLPQGMTADSIVWPRPERFVARTIVGYGYSAQVALLTAVKLPLKFAPDTVSIAAVVSWLACSDVCIPGSERLKITLPVSDAVPILNSDNAPLFAQTRRQIPQPAPFEATFIVNQEQIRLGLPRVAFPGVAKLSAKFYPFDSSVIEHAAPQTVVVEARQIEVILRRSAVSNDQIGTLDGLLILEGPATRTPRSQTFDVSARRITPPQAH